MNCNFMRLMVKTLSLFFVVFGAKIHPAALKKVLILDVVNIDKNQNYDYLVGSITDALTEKLKTNFVFKETLKADWQAAATKNDLLFEDESYTRTFAMSLGIKMKQDITISGGFRVVVVKGQQVLRATLFLIDVPNKKIIDIVEKDMPITGDLFSKVDTLALSLTKSAAKVLPGKDFYAQNKESFDLERSSLRLISEAYLLTAIGPKQFDETSSYITPSRMAQTFGGGLRYQSGLWRKFDWYVQGMFYYSGAALISQQSGTTIPQKFLGGAVTGGIGYTLDIGRRFQLTPWLGGGYFFGQTKLNYSNYSVQPVDRAGTKYSGSETLVYAPTANLGVDLSFDISQHWYVSLGATSMSFFNGPGVSTTVGATLSGGWRF